MTNAGVNIQISGEAVKWITAGACFVGFCYVLVKVIDQIPNNLIHLPEDAVDFAKLPEVSPSKFDDIEFHSGIKQRAITPFNAGDYCGAVRAATIGLYDVLRDLSGISADASELVKLAFYGEPKKGIAPALKFSELAPLHINNPESGYIDLLMGFSKSIRKIHMHAEIEISKTQALQEISLACYLADIIETKTTPYQEAAA